jgi:hypothetical protein
MTPKMVPVTDLKEKCSLGNVPILFVRGPIFFYESEDSDLMSVVSSSYNGRARGEVTVSQQN